MSPRPHLTFIAGPNGAGKTTFYQAFLRGSSRYFVNADVITRSMGISNWEAARAADVIRDELLVENESFITETVFSDANGVKLQFLERAIARGYAVRLIYVGIASVELSEARIIGRVKQGGHDVPSDRLTRRYQQSLKNFASAVKFVPEVHVYDNSSATEPYRCIATKKAGRVAWFGSVPAWLATALGRN